MKTLWIVEVKRWTDDGEEHKWMPYFERGFYCTKKAALHASNFVPNYARRHIRVSMYRRKES